MSMFLYTHRHNNLITRELAVGLCPFLSLVVRFGRSATQILQNGPRQLGQLGCAPCSPSGGSFWPLSSPNPTDLASLVRLAVLLALPLVARFGRSAAFGRSEAQILQNGPRQVGQLDVLLAFPLVVRFGHSAAQILQNGPRQLGQLGCAPCSPSGGPFCPPSSPNPSKRTSPARSAWLCSLLSLWWSFLAAQQPKSFKTDPQLFQCAGEG